MDDLEYALWHSTIVLPWNSIKCLNMIRKSQWLSIALKKGVLYALLGSKSLHSIKNCENKHTQNQQLGNVRISIKCTFGHIRGSQRLALSRLSFYFLAQVTAKVKVLSPRAGLAHSDWSTWSTRDDGVSLLQQALRLRRNKHTYILFLYIFGKFTGFISRLLNCAFWRK